MKTQTERARENEIQMYFHNHLWKEKKKCIQTYFLAWKTGIQTNFKFSLVLFVRSIGCSVLICIFFIKNKNLFLIHITFGKYPFYYFSFKFIFHFNLVSNIRYSAIKQRVLENIRFKWNKCNFLLINKKKKRFFGFTLYIFCNINTTNHTFKQHKMSDAVEIEQIGETKPRKVRTQ